MVCRVVFLVVLRLAILYEGLGVFYIVVLDCVVLCCIVLRGVVLSCVVVKCVVLCGC